MTSGGVFDRLMRASVDRAQRMQPARTQRVADDLLYATPAAREDVAAISDAASRLVGGGLTLPTVGAVAVRRSDDRATLTIAGTDLRSVDNRSLESVDLSDRRSPAMAGLRAGGGAAVHAHPPALVALAAAGGSWDEVVADLVDLAGSLRIVADVDEVRTGLTFVERVGVISTHDDAGGAVTRMEAAEMLARMTIMERQLRREHG